MSAVSEDIKQTTSTERLHGTLGLPTIVFMIVAAAAPLTVVAGPIPLAFFMGNGVGVPATLILTGVALVFFAVGYTTMTPFVTTAGAFYSYTIIGLGRKAGIGTGYAALLTYFTLYVGVFGLVGVFISSLSTAFGGPSIDWWISALAMLALLTFLGYREIELSGKILSILLISEVAIVVIVDLAIVGLGGGAEGLSTSFWEPGVIFSGAPGVTFLFAILAFIGIEAAVVFRDEAKEPEKTVPRATYVAVIFIACFYGFTAWCMVSGVGESSIISAAKEQQTELLPNLAARYVGPISVHIMQVLMVTSIFACLLSFHNIITRYLFSLANRGLLPKRLGRAHPSFGSPHIASVACGVSSAILIILGVLAKLDALSQFYTWLIGLASTGYIVLLVVTSVSVLAFFQRKDTPNISKWKTTIIPALGLLALLGFLYLVLANLMLLVGGNVGVGAAVVVLIIASYCLGPIVGHLMPESGFELD